MVVLYELGIKHGKSVFWQQAIETDSGNCLGAVLDPRLAEDIAGMRFDRVKEAAKRGFSVILVKDGHTTFDWDELTAVEAIDKHNNELAKFATLQNARGIKFR